GGRAQRAAGCGDRIAVDDPRLSLGFPEGQLGIPPGFSSTVGRGQLAGVRAVVLRSPPPRRAPLLEQLLSSAPLRPLLRRSLVAQVARRAPRDNYPAPHAIIELWARHGAQGAAAYEAEARSIAPLFTPNTSRNLVRVFLLQDRLKGAGGKSPLEIRHVHVVGAGVMGGDIAAWSALRGFTVTLQDRASELIEPAMKRAAELFDKRLRDPAKK